MIDKYEDLNGFMNLSKDYSESFLKTAYSNFKVGTYEKTTEAILYSLFLGGGGKRSRSALVFASNFVFGGKISDALKFARAVEEMHTYTLMIDDYQDNDSERRGQPSCHIKFGIDTMIMASEQLFARSLYVLFGVSDDYLRATVLSAVNKLHRGQAADIDSRNWPNELMNPEGLRYVFSGKTGALFEICLCVGAFSSGAKISESEYQNLRSFGNSLGILYQLRDDELEITEDEGISIGKIFTTRDQLSEEIDKQEKCCYEALESLKITGKNPLEDIVKYMVGRKN